jgi:hypothetical protein
VKEKLLFLAKLTIFSILLFAFKSQVSRAYGFILGTAAGITLPIFQPGVIFQLTGTDFFNIEVGFSPFLVLMLATPKMGLLKKAKIIGAGLALFLLIDLIIIWLGIPLEAGDSLFRQDSSAAYTIYRTILLILPPVLWLAANYNNLGGLFLSPEEPAKTIRTCPICKKEKAGLVDHIIAVHGHKALKSNRVQRYLQNNR